MPDGSGPHHQQKWTHAKTMGRPYDVDGLCERIEKYVNFFEGVNIRIPYLKMINTETEKMQENAYLQEWAKCRRARQHKICKKSLKL